jgi:hypothetical protein
MQLALRVPATGSPPREQGNPKIPLARAAGSRCGVWVGSPPRKQGNRSLAFEHVSDGVGEILIVANDLVIAAFCEPMPSACFLGHIRRKSRGIRQFPRTPRLELIPDVVRFSVRRHHYVNVIRSCIHRVQMPTADSAVIANRFLHKRPLLGGQQNGRLRQLRAGCLLSVWIRQLNPRSTFLHPAAPIALQPRTVCGPNNMIGDYATVKNFHRGNLACSIPLLALRARARREPDAQACAAGSRFENLIACAAGSRP